MIAQNFLCYYYCSAVRVHVHLARLPSVSPYSQPLHQARCMDIDLKDQPRWRLCLLLEFIISVFYSFWLNSAYISEYLTRKILHTILSTPRKYLIHFRIIISILTDMNSSVGVDVRLPALTAGIPLSILTPVPFRHNLHQLTFEIYWARPAGISPFRPRKTVSRCSIFVAILLLLSGNVERNPGPGSQQQVTPILLASLNVRSAVGKSALLHSIIA